MHSDMGQERILLAIVILASLRLSHSVETTTESHSTGPKFTFHHYDHGTTTPKTNEQPRCPPSQMGACEGGNGRKRPDPNFHLTDFQPQNLESRRDLPSLQESEPSLDTKLIGLLRSDLNARLERLPVPHAPRSYRSRYQPKARSEERFLLQKILERLLWAQDNGGSRRSQASEALL